jgi:riboflavin-specific deaminase-like protein
MDYGQLYPWPRDRWLRTQMVMTLDGASVGADGLSGSISSVADKKIFIETRRLADAVLVGAGTIRAERYRPMLAKPEWQQAREAIGAAAAPRVVVVSGRLDLPWDEPMFGSSHFPVIVATTEEVDADALALAREHAHVVQFGTGGTDLVALVEWLAEQGLGRVVCEGGEKLLDALVRADLVDEMDMTISPMLVGAGQLPEADHDAFDPLAGDYRRFDLAHQFENEGFVFCRFVRRGNPGR